MNIVQLDKYIIDKNTPHMLEFTGKKKKSTVISLNKKLLPRRLMLTFDRSDSTFPN